MFQKKQLKYFDFWIIILLVGITIFASFAIGSATHVNVSDDNHYVKKQLIGFCIGMILLIITSFLNYNLLKKSYLLLYSANLVLLVGVLYLGSGKGSSRWLSIGGFTIQPSEFAKIIVIIFLARFLEKKQKSINNPLVIIETIILVGVPALLINMQPDLSTSIVIVVLLATALFVSKISYKYILAVVIMLGLFVIFMLWNLQQDKPYFLKEYQVTRILSTMEPEKYKNDEAYQTYNSMQAIGSGQFEGKGLYKGTLNQFKYLPEPHTDFIYSVIGEEFGFIGCALVILLLMVIVFRCIWNAIYAPDLFGTLLCTGVATMIIFQSFVNMGVTTGIVPNTGIPLPFVSYGLSSLLTNMIGIGLVINVGMMRKTKFSWR